MYQARKTIQHSSRLPERSSGESKNNLKIFCPTDMAGSDCIEETCDQRLEIEADQQSPLWLEQKQLMFRSQVMREITDRARRYARSSAPILVMGESGTGKERLCRLIHQESVRARQRFVAINCAAMPELLVESELFGHDRGAFTGAFQQRLGHFQHAHRGTLLLDEISEIPISTQAKLLRAIEEQEVLRVGRSTPEKVDVRILATSNRDVRDSVEAGNFRNDLYYRVSVLQLKIPPLRDRKDDIPMLAEHFLQVCSTDLNVRGKKFTPAAIKALSEYHWPGNVRELRNVVQCACIESGAGPIDVEFLPLFDTTESNTDMSIGSLASVERLMILASLKRHRGNRSAAAAELGITARTLSNKIKIYSQQ
jgi:transcriptional regulator with PAS, ATPase and Fis domain